MKKLLLLLGCISAMSVSAQRQCVTDKQMKRFFDKNTVAAANKESLRNFLITNDYGKNAKAETVVTIPVVVHVLYKNNTQNVSDAQIMSQLKVLNDDFRKVNANFNTIVPDAFKPMAADLELAFTLATKKPDGTATTGIERKSVSSSFNFGNNYYKTSGLPAWDPTKYLNIWVGKFDGYDEYGDPWAGTLGFAYLPDAAGEPYDGLCIGYDSFGTMGTASAPFNLGRTGTHEIGHYFGLNHIWGDEENSCGTSAGDDGCADTPATKEPYFDTPTYPTNKYACTTTATGSMFMNYMDYVDDKSMGMFTNDQKTITKNTLLGPRASLLTLGVNDIETSKSINVYPNPAGHFISISSPLVKISEVEIFNTEGKLVKTAKLQSQNEQIDVKQLPVGIYYLRTYDQGNLVKSMKFVKK